MLERGRYLLMDVADLSKHEPELKGSTGTSPSHKSEVPVLKARDGLPERLYKNQLIHPV